MCGIAGYIGREKILKKHLSQTLNLMKNRGPDFRKCLNYKYKDLNIFLLHSRLKIIDLANEANQPFKINNLTLIFNGEIYNFIEIREILRKKGIKFKTKSDTEVLLRAYINYGTKCFKKFEGMWSIVIWDNNSGKVILSRDRFGEKPLYTYHTSKGLFFASEIKFLKSLSQQKFKINKQQITRYLIQGYKSLYKENLTFYEGIKSFPISSFAKIGKNFKYKAKKYWELKYKPKKIKLSKAIKKTRELLENSMKIRLRSDVPIAFCLSGGIDSNSLVKISKLQLKNKIKAYSVLDFDDDYNEKKIIDKTVKNSNINHEYIKVNENKILKYLTNLIEYHDQPIATSNFLFHSFIAKKSSKDGFKVLISGIGADEIFSGYYDHTLQYLYETKNHKKFSQNLKDWKQKILKYIKNPVFKNYKLYINNPNYRKHLFDKSYFLKNFLNQKFSNLLLGDIEKKYTKNLLRNRMMNELFHEGVRVCLNEDDLNCMMYSVENRSPFLDSKLCEFLYTIPSHMLMKNGFTKYLLRKSVEDEVEKDIILNTKKVGFNVSIKSFVNFNSVEFKKRFLSIRNPTFDFINRNKFIKLIKNVNNRKKYSKFIFNFINLSIFLKKNYDYK